ncbi:Rcs stress response system protein RcsF [Shewanella sp.]|uniref:Rcs stress response system protein RcsF n=1 Tax=Shewanella sp. TaxID=50422 RepID=UPI003A982245
MKVAFPVVSLSLLLLSGCSNYTFHSNLDKDEINNYFKPSQVTLYENRMPDAPYTALGMIEGTDCQIDENASPASLANARTDARRKAADKNANGIIMQKCAAIPEPAEGCFSRTLCIGQAIKVSGQ